MTEDDEYRLALGKRADDLGRVLARVGSEYEIRAAGDPPSSAAEFRSTELADIDNFLARLEQHT